MKQISIPIILCVVALSASCKVQKAGLVVMTDDSYKANVVAATRDGIGSADGLLWRDGKLFLADEGSKSIEIWSNTEGLKVLSDSNHGFQSPEDLVIDADGNLFFTDDDAGGLWEIDKRGATRLVAGKDKGLISTEGIALAPDGSILVGDGEQHKVFRVTRDGTVSDFLGRDKGITKPESMVFDDQGNLYIADNQDDVLYLVDRNLEIHRLVDRKDSFSPETIFFSKGALYITDSRNGKLYIYRPNEELRVIAAFGGQLKDVQGVSVDDQGNIYLSVQNDLKRNVGTIIEISKDQTAVAKK